jgi:hypothetical protein
MAHLDANSELQSHTAIVCSSARAKQACICSRGMRTIAAIVAAIVTGLVLAALALWLVVTAAVAIHVILASLQLVVWSQVHKQQYLIVGGPWGYRHYLLVCAMQCKCIELSFASIMNAAGQQDSLKFSCKTAP